MTVIAWDGKTLAADKQSTCNGFPGTATKIRRAPNGALLSSCGDADMGRELAEWYSRGADIEKYPGNRTDSDDCYASLMVILKEHGIQLYGCGPYPSTLENKFFAMGSGADFALAAMHLGHDAVEAVAVASALDIHCGNGVDTLELE